MLYRKYQRTEINFQYWDLDAFASLSKKMEQLMRRVLPGKLDTQLTTELTISGQAISHGRKRTFPWMSPCSWLQRN
jgi:FixJ family two-component response regulator